jgi:hypothetical protein
MMLLFDGTSIPQSKRSVVVEFDEPNQALVTVPPTDERTIEIFSWPLPVL